MSSIAADTTELKALLDTLIDRHNVPGVSATVALDGGIETITAGVANRETGWPLTADTVLQIGSVTKVWTATLVMQLVDEGHLALDACVVDILPEFRPPGEAERITIRHLLTHSSGLAGDNYTDTGRGDDAIERYLTTMAEFPALHGPGALLAYCDAGIVTLGRIVEVLRGCPYHEALERHLVRPLGLESTCVLPEHILLRPTANGYKDPDDTGELIRARRFYGPRALTPAGGIVSTSRELAVFGRMYLNGGRAEDGTPVISAAAIEEMWREQILGPDPSNLACGLGWFIYDWGGTKAVGHNGDTIGQSAFLRLVPSHRLVIAMQANQFTGGPVFDAFAEHVAARAGIETTAPAELPLPNGNADLDAADYAGTYRSASIEAVVSTGAPGTVEIAFRVFGTVVENWLDDPVEGEFTAWSCDDKIFAIDPEGGQYVTFALFDGGQPTVLVFNGRALARMPNGAP